MSYEIVFKTIIVEKDGKIYHFSRSGCNNDNAGRKDEDYTVKVYNNRETALKDIEKKFKGGFEEDLKLNSKFVNYDYYYKYLKKKIEKPINYKTFKTEYYSDFHELVNFTCLNNNCTYSILEDENVWTELYNKYGILTIRRNFKELQFEDLENKLNNVRIYIKKRKIYK